MLLERAYQAISATDVQRNSKEIFNKLQSGEQDKFVVMRDNRPAFVMLSLRAYEAMLEELQALRP